MALLVKRASSPFYYARFQVKGKARWLSTKKTTRKEVEQALRLLVAQARNTLSVDEQVAVLVRLLDALPKDLQAVKRQEVVRTVFGRREKRSAGGRLGSTGSQTRTRNMSRSQRRSWVTRPSGNGSGVGLRENLHFLHEVSADHARDTRRTCGNRRFLPAPTISTSSFCAPSSMRWSWRLG